MIKAHYPSGRTVTARHGVFDVIDLPGGDCKVPIIEDVEEGRVIILDGRCVVLVNGHLEYNPRAYINVMQKELADWMRENPKWPPTRLIAAPSRC